MQLLYNILYINIHIKSCGKTSAVCLHFVGGFYIVSRVGDFNNVIFKIVQVQKQRLVITETHTDTHTQFIKSDIATYTLHTLKSLKKLQK